MLVLTRKVGQEIRIGEVVRVRVVAIMGNKIRLSIAAPPSIRIDREEVHMRRVCASASDLSASALEPSIS